jgi:hypothetical protein
MCEHRQFFASCLLKIHVGEDYHMFKFVYAMQNPLLVCLMAVDEVDGSEHALTPSAFHHECVDMWEFTFLAKWSFRYSDDSVFDGATLVEVMTDAIYCSGGRICCDNTWQSLSTLMAILPYTGRGMRNADETAEPVKRAPNFTSEPWMAYPGMWDFINEGADQDCPDSPDEDDVSDHDNEDVALDRMDPDAAVAMLLERRLELGDDGMEDSAAFYRWVLRGGKWTGAKKGVAFDCYKPFALNDTAASDFVDLYPSLKLSASFSIALYGDGAALTLARSWIHRHFFFLAIWMAADCSPAYVFTDADVDAYIEPADLVALASLAVMGSKLAMRVQTIRDIRPR